MSAIPIPALDRWRAEACRVLTDPTSTESLRRLAWHFLKTQKLKTGGARP